MPGQPVDGGRQAMALPETIHDFHEGKSTDYNII
jgi:hypothetical protein